MGRAKRSKSKYRQPSVRKRIEAFLLDHVGEVVTGKQIEEVARDPETGARRENWHQRLSELRTDFGYNIQSWRDTAELGVSEYRLISAVRRETAGKRVKIDPRVWKAVQERAGYACEWREEGTRCGLKAGDIDPRGGGTVRLTPDHKTPHATHAHVDPKDPDQWQALCGRHQVVKKNYWDHRTGKLNVYAIIQAAPDAVKREVYAFLKTYFKD